MSIKKNYIYQLSYQLINLLVPLITLPYVTKVLKADNMGEYTYYFSIISFLMIIGTLGTNIYGVREVARVNKINKELKEIFEGIQGLRILTLSLTFILCVVLNIFFIKSKVFSIQIIMLVSLVFDISWFYQGIENFKKVAIRNISMKFLTLILLFLLVKQEKDIYIYSYLLSLSQLFSNILFWKGLKKTINYEIINFFKIKKIKINLKKSFFLFLPQITISIYTILDKLMIGSLVEKRYVSFYSVSNRIVIMSMVIITSSGAILMPRISTLYENGSEKDILKLLKNSFDILTIISIGMIFGIVSVIDTIVVNYFSVEYTSIAFLIKVMSITIIFWTWNNITGSQILIPTNQENKITKSVIVGSIINFILNMILIRKYYALGAVIATIITEGVVTFIQIYYSKKYFQFNYKIILKSIISGLTMYLIINRIPNLIAQILIGVCLYTIILLILGEITLLIVFKKIFKRGKK